MSIISESSNPHRFFDLKCPFCSNDLRHIEGFRSRCDNCAATFEPCGTYVVPVDLDLDSAKPVAEPAEDQESDSQDPQVNTPEVLEAAGSEEEPDQTQTREPQAPEAAPEARRGVTQQLKRQRSPVF